jgi:hypothetical protein
MMYYYDFEYDDDILLDEEEAVGADRCPHCGEDTPPCFTEECPTCGWPV